jgi:hypothetical protein
MRGERGEKRRGVGMSGRIRHRSNMGLPYQQHGPFYKKPPQGHMCLKKSPIVAHM